MEGILQDQENFMGHSQEGQSLRWKFRWKFTVLLQSIAAKAR